MAKDGPPYKSWASDHRRFNFSNICNGLFLLYIIFVF